MFVTWRLWGSLPRERVFDREHGAGAAFMTMDRLLDTARSGPVYVRRPEVADVVSQQLRVADCRGLCSLHAYVVMQNHVHVLWTPRVSLPVASRDRRPVRQINYWGALESHSGRKSTSTA